MRATRRERLGTSAVEVTRLGFGSAPLGNLFEPLSDEDAVATLERAWDLGIRHFDTAPLYGFGLAERRLGELLAHQPRAEVTVATKVGRSLSASASIDPALVEMFKEAPPLGVHFDFSHDAVMRSIEESLDRLGLDRIDIVHIHDPDDHFERALDSAYPTLHALRSQGVIGAIGAGMNQVEMLTRFAREADFDCFLLAGRYTLLDHDGLGALMAACAERDTSLIVGGVYNSGILAGPGGDATFDYVRAPPELIDRAHRLEAVCARHGVPLKAAAIQFPLGGPAVASVLTGSRSVAEIEENLRMFELSIPADLWAELRAAGLLAADLPVPGPAA